jgi:predicted site-specific integrase-resolvase
MAKIGYARVSSLTQDYRKQVDALNAAGCEKIYSEKVSGKSTKDRRQFDKLMKALLRAIPSWCASWIGWRDRRATCTTSCTSWSSRAAASSRWARAGATPRQRSAPDGGDHVRYRSVRRD